MDLRIERALLYVYTYIYLYCIRYTYILYTHIVPYPSDIIICTVVSGTLELENFFLYNGRINAKYRSVYAVPSRPNSIFVIRRFIYFIVIINDVDHKFFLR